MFRKMYTLMNYSIPTFVRRLAQPRSSFHCSITNRVYGAIPYHRAIPIPNYCLIASVVNVIRWPLVKWQMPMFWFLKAIVKMSATCFLCCSSDMGTLGY